MTTPPLDPFEGALALTIENLVRQHHTIYPWLPPQGIYFEALAHRAFSLCGIPGVQIAQTSPNQPEHDLIVGGARISLKTETGKGTKPERISITKLCTTERDPWESGILVARVMAHLARYDRLLMLRALWSSSTHIAYQLLEVPVATLRQLAMAELDEVGTRKGRRSIGGDVIGTDGGVLFHVHFDGADGKCQIRNRRVSSCKMLRTWDQRLS